MWGRTAKTVTEIANVAPLCTPDTSRDIASAFEPSQWTEALVFELYEREIWEMKM